MEHNQIDDLNRYGFVAFMDCLAYKGIWRWHSLQDVVRKISAARDSFKRIVCEPANVGIGPTRKMAVFSDTVVITSTVTIPDDIEPTELEGALLGLTEALGDIWTVMLCGPPARPRLALRGAVTWGEHTVTDPFIVGPAVDEAYERERLAQGAFVWFTQSTEELIDRVRGNSPLLFAKLPIVRTEIPLKTASGGIVETPCWVLRPRLTADHVRDLLFDAFRLAADGAEVPGAFEKFHNTVSFFERTQIPEE